MFEVGELKSFSSLEFESTRLESALSLVLVKPAQQIDTLAACLVVGQLTWVSGESHPCESPAEPVMLSTRAGRWCWCAEQ